MRIISGEYKGRVLKTKLPEGVRPTTDRNREMIFSMLTNYVDFDELVVLDLFAGAGLLGLEALSRGAEKCYFNDKNPKIAGLIQSFSEELGIKKDRVSVLTQDAFLLLSKLSQKPNEGAPKINLLFIDPPYSLCATKKILKTLIELPKENSLIHQRALVVLEYGYFENVSYKDESFVSKIEVLRQKQIGETRIDFLQLV